VFIKEEVVSMDGAPGLSLREQGRVDTLQVVVREQTPFLPKVAFTLITLASMGGAVFTGRGMGLGVGEIALRWLSLWSLALAGGFLVWRTIYVRTSEPEVEQVRLDALNQTALTRADVVGRWTAPIVLAGAPGILVVPWLDNSPALRWSMVAATVVLAGLLALGVSHRTPAVVATALAGLLISGWAYADAGSGMPGVVRALHLTAFTLWLGGALWNIAVAMRAGREHPNLDAVLAGARQLDRFRWVVRFVLPTIIGTGLIMAWGYRAVELEWWMSFPGVLIPLKVLCIVALVVVFITCPLFRHCSPVQGVCNIDDLDE
jgi:hypothetical protein